MILIACVDDRLGLLFNRRRQSQDRRLRQRLLEQTGGAPLWMNAYSAAQFEDAAGLLIDENCLEKAGSGEFCFVEDLDPAPFAHRLEKILLYKWNRVYPADRFFTLPLAAGGWQLQEKTDFPGYSHPTITEEIYTR